MWNCLNLVPGLQALRLYRYPWAACLGNSACISSWQKHIRGTTAPIHLDGHPLHRVRSSHTAQTKTPLRGFFGRDRFRKHAHTAWNHVEISRYKLQKLHTRPQDLKTT